MGNINENYFVFLNNYYFLLCIFSTNLKTSKKPKSVNTTKKCENSHEIYQLTHTAVGGKAAHSIMWFLSSAAHHS